MTFEEKRRELHNKRNKVGATSELGHRYSKAISHLEQQEKLQKLQAENYQQIEDLEMAELLA